MPRRRAPQPLSAKPRIQAAGQHNQWRRSTRRDAYTDLVITVYDMRKTFKEHVREQGYLGYPDASGQLTDQMQEAVDAVERAAVVTRIEGPPPISSRAARVLGLADDLVRGWTTLPLDLDTFRDAETGEWVREYVPAGRHIEGTLWDLRMWLEDFLSTAHTVLDGPAQQAALPEPTTPAPF